MTPDGKLPAEPLPQSFFARPAPELALALLGQLLVRQLPNGTCLKARIVETEAYQGMDDTACHARMGRTERNAVMFGQAGHAYVYLIYGMYDMLNLVCDQEGVPAAVLIRAVEPVEGIAELERVRGVRGPSLTNGPGRLCRALQLDRSLNGASLVSGPHLWLEPGPPLEASQIERSPRVGIDYAEPAHRNLLWRFFERGSRWVSVPPRPKTPKAKVPIEKTLTTKAPEERSATAKALKPRTPKTKRDRQG